jgi:RNA polymerase sigma-70 factor (ECF subfamily)
VKKPDEAWYVARAAWAGDREAFSCLVEAYQSPIRRFLFHLTADEELAKDLAQETFIKAWLHIASFRAAARFSTWLYRIAYNTFYDSARGAKPVDALADTHTADTPDADLSLDFASALTVLKEEERTAMLLYYMEDQPVARIAAIMGCPPGTVKSHLYRGREKLAVYFKNEER